MVAHAQKYKLAGKASILWVGYEVKKPPDSLRT